MPRTARSATEESKKSPNHPTIRIAPHDLDLLLNSLEVNVLALSECLVSPGYRLDMGGVPLTGLHYNLKGKGRMLLGNSPPIELKPHTLIIAPANTPFCIDCSEGLGSSAKLRSINGRRQSTQVNGINRFIAGDDEPEILLICGFFTAFYGTSIDLFSAVNSPIIEQFDESDKLERALRIALNELVAQEAGSGAMTSAMLKQVIITLLRRSLTSVNAWVERFGVLSDPQIARSFAQMAANPGANHTVMTLAEKACLSRSSFMARFTDLVGQSPMAILREFRMRQAAKQLVLKHLSIDQIAHASGYDSRSSFVKAFRKTYSCDPTQYRESMKLGAQKN